MRQELEQIHHKLEPKIERMVRDVFDNQEPQVVCQIASFNIVIRCDGGAVGALECALFDNMEPPRDGKIQTAINDAMKQSKEHIAAIMEYEAKSDTQ